MVKDIMTRRYTPFDGFEGFFGQMGRGFESMVPATTDSGMAVDDDAFVVTADLPGYDRSDIDLTVDDSVVTITAEHQQNAAESEDDGSYLHRERHTTSIQRRLTLPDDVDDEQATAAYHNGVLTVTLPKQSSVAIEDGRRIEIE
jgi:HSP20 family protein